MDVVAAERLRADLSGFTEDVFGSLTRAGWRERAALYQRGLMIDGRRKWVQTMAARLRGTVHKQALNHFVANSPWDVEPVRSWVAELVDEAVIPAAWAVDDTGLLKCGTASPCVARQYTGTAGKVTNCQIAATGRRLGLHDVAQDFAQQIPPVRRSGNLVFGSHLSLTMRKCAGRGTTSGLMGRPIRTGWTPN